MPMPYVVPTGFSTLIFGTLNIFKKFGEILKKLAVVLGIANKSVETLPVIKK